MTRTYKLYAHLLAGCLAATMAAEVVAAPPVPRPQTPPAVGSVYIVGGELHVGDGTVVKNATIEVRNGRIRSVAAGGAAPANAQTINATGKWITPGLIAADTGLGLTEIELEPSTRDDSLHTEDPIHAAYDAASAINSRSSAIQVHAIDGITTAAVAPSGGLISGQVAWIDLVYGDDAGMVAKAGVAVDAALGQAYGGSRAATLDKLTDVLDEARKFPQRKQAHDRGQSRKLAADFHDLEALGPLLRGQAVLTLACDRASDIRAAIALAKRFGIKLVIVGGAEAWRVAPELAQAKIPVVVQPTNNLPRSFDRIGARSDLATVLQKAGVEVVIGRPGDVHNIHNLTQEAGVAVAHGLTWEQALSAVTRNVAQAYGMDKDYGTVATGKVANIVIWDGDPFELSSAPTQVLIRGQAIPMVSRQTLLRDRYRDLSRFRP